MFIYRNLPTVLPRVIYTGLLTDFAASQSTLSELVEENKGQCLSLSTI
jgi:hypothetical protein